ncbi:MAG: hypothetical protein ABIL39_06010 [candidate division WOR-3 bacterium]
MAEEILNRIEERGLGLPFIVKKDGTIFTSKGGADLGYKFNQTATVVFETIGALGGIKIENLEIIGKNQSLLCEISEEEIIGHLFATVQMAIYDNILEAIKELKKRGEAIVKEEAKPKEKYPPEFLDELKKLVQEYLGDFAERVFQNQLKAQRIKPEELYEEEIRRFIFALGKAAGMIIGPTKGRDLTNKLLARLK